MSEEQKQREKTAVSLIKQTVKDLDLRGMQFSHPLDPLSTVQFKDWYLDCYDKSDDFPDEVCKSMLEAFKLVCTHMDSCRINIQQSMRMLLELLMELRLKPETKKVDFGFLKGQPSVDVVQEQVVPEEAEEVEEEKEEPVEESVEESREEEVEEPVQAKEAEPLGDFEDRMRQKFEEGLSFIDKHGRPKPKNPACVANGLKRFYCSTPSEEKIVGNLFEEYKVKYSRATEEGRI